MIPHKVTISALESWDYRLNGVERATLVTPALPDVTDTLRALTLHCADNHISLRKQENTAAVLAPLSQ